MSTTTTDTCLSQLRRRPSRSPPRTDDPQASAHPRHPPLLPKAAAMTNTSPYSPAFSLPMPTASSLNAPRAPPSTAAPQAFAYDLLAPRSASNDPSSRRDQPPKPNPHGERHCGRYQNRAVVLLITATCSRWPKGLAARAVHRQFTPSYNATGAAPKPLATPSEEPR